MTEEPREEKSCMEVGNPAGGDAPANVSAAENPEAARAEEERLEREYAGLEAEEEGD